MSNTPFRKTKADGWQEPDWDLLDCIDRLERDWEGSLCAQLPKSEAGWLKIFPDGSTVIPEKLQEWQEVADAARVAIGNALETIGEKSPERDHSFGRAILKYTFLPVSELVLAQRQIKRLKWVLPGGPKNKGLFTWNEALDRARHADLIEVAKSYGLQLRRSGKTYSAHCPLHTERTPSFHIYPPSRFICFGCDVKGDAITFVQKMESCSFKEAVYKLQHV